ncbi:MAG: hypothetical protein KDD83_29255, partial [Caldilineaceae bacterium]|nr:hypothetical protein [Caldilineaceae bacterium]
MLRKRFIGWGIVITMVCVSWVAVVHVSVLWRRPPAQPFYALNAGCDQNTLDIVNPDNWRVFRHMRLPQACIH